MIENKKRVFYVSIFSFFMEKRKHDKKKFDLPQRGFESRIFEQAPADNLNFEGD